MKYSLQATSKFKLYKTMLLNPLKYLSIARVTKTGQQSPSLEKYSIKHKTANAIMYNHFLQNKHFIFHPQHHAIFLVFYD